MTIQDLQRGRVDAGICVEVTGVGTSDLFGDPDDTRPNPDGGAPLPHTAFYLGELGSLVTTPRSGIEVVFVDNPEPLGVFRDTVRRVVGRYEEHNDNSTVRMVLGCSDTSPMGGAVGPNPPAVTVAFIGQRDGGPGCPANPPWVDGVAAEDYEGVLVRITSGRVLGPSDSRGSFEVGFNGYQLQVTQALAQYPRVDGGESVNFINGYAHYAGCRRQLRVRSFFDFSLDAGP